MDASELLGARIAATTAGRPGAVVQSVQPTSKTLLERGDVIIAVDGTPVASAGDVTAAIDDLELGKEVRFTVIRGSRRIALTEVPSPTTYLGANVREANGGDGVVVVVSITKNSPAAASRMQPGDRITAVDGTPVDNVSDLLEAIGTHQPGEKATITVARGPRQLDLTVTLARRQN